MAALLCFFVLSLPLAFGFPSSTQVNQPNFESSLSPDSVVSSPSTSEEQTCPTGEHWYWCGADCQKTCTNKDRHFICRGVCVPGCVCNGVYVRDIDGKCIPPRLCPSSDHENRESSKIAFRCPRNQHWDSCNAHCGRNCANYNKSPPCPSICISGCICDAGYIWGPDGDCILPSQCPLQSVSSSIETDGFCPPNEEFSQCLAHCQRNCSNWSNPNLPCLKICVPGCICKNGMVRGPHGNCIFPRQCPPRDSLGDLSGQIECPVDEHFERCSAHCQKNCSNWNQLVSCSEICVAGCVCDAPYVRSTTGKCVPSQNCTSPKQVSNTEKENADDCPEHEHRSTYNVLPHSKTLCILDNDFIDFCPPTYLSGCICDKGLFRGHDNKCIDTRFLPNANELEFLHIILETSSKTEEEDDCHDIIDDQEMSIIDIPFPNTESEEQENDDSVTYNQFPVTDSSDFPNDLYGDYTLNTENDERPLTLLQAVLTHQTESDSSPDGGCPDSNVCNQQCNSSLHKVGYCIGKYYERCVCYEL